MVEDDPIEQVKLFRYLCIDISSTYDPVKDQRNHINEASALLGCLRDIIWSNPYMPKDSKIRIYKTIIKTIMTYGIEVRVDTHKMRTLRTIVERMRRDRVGNTDFIEQCGRQDIVKWGRQRRDTGTTM